jgi:hypothetical protein
MSPVRYELGFYIPADSIFHSHRSEKRQILHSINRLDFVAETKVSPVRFELCFYIPENGILYSNRYENFKSYTALTRLGFVSQT